MKVLGRKKLSVKDLHDIYNAKDIQERASDNNLNNLESKTCSGLFKIIVLYEPTYGKYLKNLISNSTKFRNVFFCETMEDIKEVTSKHSIKLMISSYFLSNELKTIAKYKWDLKQREQQIPDMLVIANTELTKHNKTYLEELEIDFLESNFQLKELTDKLNEKYLNFLDDLNS